MRSAAIKKLLLFFQLLLAGSMISSAQEAKVDVNLDSSSYLIGDYIRADFSATFPDGWELSWPDYINTGSHIEFVNLLPIDTNRSDGLVSLFTRVNYIVFDSGVFAFPQMTFSLLNRDNNDTLTLYSDSIVFSVTSPEVDTSLAIKPIKAPLTVKRPFPWWILLIIVAALVISAILFLYLKRRKTTVSKQLVVKKEPRDPWLHAMNSLKSLEEEKLWQNGEVKEYYSKLTDVLREYIEYRYKKPALESTSDEILEDLTTVGVQQTQREQLSFLFQTSDLVKFAKGFPLADDHTRCMQYGYDFLRNTKAENEIENNGRAKT